MAFVNNNTTFTPYLLLIFVVLLCSLFNIQMIILFLTGKPTEMAPWKGETKTGRAAGSAQGQVNLTATYLLKAP